MSKENVFSGAGRHPAEIMIVGEAWGENERLKCSPFVGASGHLLDKMLEEVGLHRGSCWATNVVNAQPPGNDISAWIPERKRDITPSHIKLRDRSVLPIVLDGYRNLLFEIEQVKPNVIIALGTTALWALTGEWGISKWRGSVLKSDLGPIVIPTFHPAAVLREWALRAIVVQDLRRAVAFQHTRELPTRKVEYLIRPSFDAVIANLENLIENLNEGPLWLEFDIETRQGHIACAGISWSHRYAICVPFMCVERPEGYWNESEETAIVYTLWRLLRHPNARVRWQNGLYDAQYTHRWWGFVPRGYQDTMISQHILFPGLRKALDFQASMYCDNTYRYWKDDGKEWSKGIGEDQLWAYNCEDCVRTREVGTVELSLVQKMGLGPQHDFHQRLFWPVLYAMNKGVRIDLSQREAFDKELTEELKKREDYFLDVLGHKLNPQSPKQLMALFYDDLQMKPILKRRVGGAYTPSLDDEALEILKNREPVLRKLFLSIQEHRSLNVFRSTFVNAKLDEYDGRMRSSFNICGTETYRFSSSRNAFGSGTNLQNIPKGGEDDDSGLRLPNVRKLFIPDEGYECFDTDLSKADLRVVVWESDEREMKSMLAEGRDPYVETAREFYKDPTISKTLPNGEENPRYRTFKSFAHGSHYLGTPQGLSKRLGLTVHECERTQTWYFGKYPRIRAWQQDLTSHVSSKHYVQNVFGYRRHYFDRITPDIFRQAAAWIPQSTIGILIDKIWLNVYDATREIEILVQVHDALFGQYPIAKRDECLKALKQCSYVELPYDDPLVIPVGVKTSTKSWGDCH